MTLRHLHKILVYSWPIYNHFAFNRLSSMLCSGGTSQSYNLLFLVSAWKHNTSGAAVL